MHKLWQKKLELNYSKNVQDIVQYGSSVIEDNDPNDIDIAVIYKKISLKDQLNESQKIKKQLQKYSELSIHIKSYDFYSLFNNSNFARESILLYGISLISKESFSKTFGLVPKIQISYNLIKFEKKEKVRFHYLLKGKKNNSGLLNKHKGKLLNPGLIEIDPKYEKIFVDSFNARKIKFQIYKIYKKVN